MLLFVVDTCCSLCSSLRHVSIALSLRACVLVIFYIYHSLACKMYVNVSLSYVVTGSAVQPKCLVMIRCVDVAGSLFELLLAVHTHPSWRPTHQEYTVSNQTRKEKLN